MPPTNADDTDALEPVGAAPLSEPPFTGRRRLVAERDRLKAALETERRRHALAEEHLLAAVTRLAAELAAAEARAEKFAGKYADALAARIGDAKELTRRRKSIEHLADETRRLAAERDRLRAEARGPRVFTGPLPRIVPVYRRATADAAGEAL